LAVASRPNGFLDFDSPENVVPRFRTTGRILVFPSDVGA